MNATPSPSRHLPRWVAALALALLVLLGAGGAALWRTTRFG